MPISYEVEPLAMHRVDLFLLHSSIRDVPVSIAGQSLSAR
jgi:hypothetical protein